MIKGIVEVLQNQNCQPTQNTVTQTGRGKQNNERTQMKTKRKNAAKKFFLKNKTIKNYTPFSTNTHTHTHKHTHIHIHTHAHKKTCECTTANSSNTDPLQRKKELVVCLFSLGGSFIPSPTYRFSSTCIYSTKHALAHTRYARI